MTKAAAAEIIELPAEPAERRKPKRQRPHQKFARYNDDELAEFERRAAEAGLTDAAYIRVSTIGDAGLPRSRRRPLDEQGRLTAAHTIAVNRVGANVNQGIQALNKIALTAPQATSRDRLADELMANRELLREMQKALDDTLAASRAALGR
jgi:hypothetical protein